MRESIGTVSLLNFIFVFLFIVIAIIAGTLSYYKSYRVNNVIVRSIEKYEGYNLLSEEAARNGLNTLAYERIEIKCPSTRRMTQSINGKKQKRDGILVNNKSYKDDAYCVYKYENDTIDDKDGRYDTYEVVTYMYFDFPVVETIFKLRTSAKTIRIYHFAD